MPKKSKGSNSKRVSLKDKFKVIKKVKEHNRKKRKEAKKAGKRKPSLLKDPGVPNNFPYREQVVKELKFEQQRILAHEQAQQDARKERKAARQVRVLPTACGGTACHWHAGRVHKVREVAARHEQICSGKYACLDCVGGRWQWR
jgi:GNL3L/Grn1 putative GTPase